MPTYQYECSSCDNAFEVFQAMADEPLKVCPKCGKAVKRVIGGGMGVIFKGSGFYKNDSRSSSTSGREKKTEASPCSACAAKNDSACPASKS